MASGMKKECKDCFGTGRHGGYEETLSECQVCQGSGNEQCEHGNDAYDCETCADERHQELTDRYAEYYRGVL